MRVLMSVWIGLFFFSASPLLSETSCQQNITSCKESYAGGPKSCDSIKGYISCLKKVSCQEYPAEAQATFQAAAGLHRHFCPPSPPEMLHWFSEEGGSPKVSCGKGKVMAGLQCHGDNCDNILPYCVEAPLTLKGSHSGNGEVHDQVVNIENILDNFSGVLQNLVQPASRVYALQCHGSDCSSLTQHERDSADTKPYGMCYETPQFSEGDDNMPDRMFCDWRKGFTISAVRCHHHRCDNKTLVCCK